MLFRPVGKPFRVGLSGKPEVVAPYRPRPGQLPVIAGRPVYSATVSPGVLSIGASWRPEAGGVRYNARTPIAQRELVEKGQAAGPPEVAKGVPPARWLLSAQLDLIQPEGNAVPLRTITNATAEAVGQLLLWEPRVGAEYEILVNRLRGRMGTYLEPSAFQNVAARPHLAGSVEVKLFHLVEDWDLSASFDVSRQYFNLGLSIGWWHDAQG